MKRVLSAALVAIAVSALPWPAQAQRHSSWYLNLDKNPVANREAREELEKEEYQRLVTAYAVCTLRIEKEVGRRWLSMTKSQQEQTITSCVRSVLNDQ